MSKIIYHSRRKRIPVFAIIYNDNGTEPDVEFYNKRSKEFETMPISEFISSIKELVPS